MFCNNAVRKRSPASPRYRNAHEPIFTAHPSESLLSSPQTAPFYIDIVFPSRAFRLSAKYARICRQIGYAGLYVIFLVSPQRLTESVREEQARARAITTFPSKWHRMDFYPFYSSPSSPVVRYLHPIFSSLRGSSISSILLCARRPLYLFLDTCSIPSMSRTKDNVVANSRSNERWLYVARWVGCLRVRDMYRVGSGGCWWDRPRCIDDVNSLPRPSAFVGDAEGSLRGLILEICFIVMKL